MSTELAASGRDIYQNVQLGPGLSLDPGAEDSQLQARLIRRHEQVVVNRQHHVRCSGIRIVC
jgi:hypothetical protein